MNSSSRSKASQKRITYQDCEEFLLSVVSGNQPAHYHLMTGGSRIRMRVCLDMSLCLGLNDEDAMRLASAVELLHNASLIHDDIQDGDSLRRGQSAVWVKFGTNLAICTGDYLIARAFGTLANISSPNVLPQLLEATQNAVSVTIEGQNADLTAKEHISSPNYESIAEKKAGPLLALALELPLISSGRLTEIPTAKHAASSLAIAYQILDDIKDSVEDAKLGRPNLLNLNLLDRKPEDAIKLTQDRAVYLIKSCERDLLAMPTVHSESLQGVIRKLLFMAQGKQCDGL